MIIKNLNYKFLCFAKSRSQGTSLNYKLTQHSIAGKTRQKFFDASFLNRQNEAFSRQVFLAPNRSTWSLYQRWHVTLSIITDPSSISSKLGPSNWNPRAFFQPRCVELTFFLRTNVNFFFVWNKAFRRTVDSNAYIIYHVCDDESLIHSRCECQSTEGGCYRKIRASSPRRRELESPPLGLVRHDCQVEFRSSCAPPRRQHSHTAGLRNCDGVCWHRASAYGDYPFDEAFIDGWLYCSFPISKRTLAVKIFPRKIEYESNF